MNLDLTKEFEAPHVSPHAPPPSSMVGVESQKTERLILLHAFFVSFGFLVLLPAGSLFARYARAFTTGWFKYHWKMNFVVAGPVITIGVLLGPLIVFSKTSYRIHFANAHEVCVLQITQVPSNNFKTDLWRPSFVALLRSSDVGTLYT